MLYICTAWIVLKYNQILLQAAKIGAVVWVCATLSIWQVVPLHRDCLKPWKYKLYPGCLLSPTMFCFLLRTHDDNALCDPCGGCSDNLKLGSPALKGWISHISVQYVLYGIRCNLKYTENVYVHKYCNSAYLKSLSSLEIICTYFIFGTVE